MLIAVAGSIGAGKSTVADSLATQLGIPMHSIDDDKRAVGTTTPEFEHWVEAGIPFPDDFRRAAFERALDGLRALAATERHVMVEETFHRKAIRDPFFDRGGALLGGFALVEVVASEATIAARLAGRAQTEADHLAGAAMYEAFVAVSDPQDRVDYRFDNDTADYRSQVAACCAFLRRRMKEHAG